VLRPKVGSTQRFRVRVSSKITMTTNDGLFGGGDAKHTVLSLNEYYVKQTVKAIKADSTVDLTFQIDSIRVKTEQDTMKLEYSSSNAKDRKDPRFLSNNALLGKDFGVIVSKHGDILEMYGTNGLVDALITDVPDSLKTPSRKSAFNRQVQVLLGQYVSRTLTHLPAKPLAKDSAWSARVETQLPVSQTVQFPVTVSSVEKVKGFEDRGGAILAVLEATTVTSPIQTKLEQGGVKATLKNFQAKANGTTRIDDKSGLLVQRSLTESRAYTFTLESAQQQGKVYQNTMDASETTNVDLLQ
jgi:hypothetical protein